jgi:acetate kinase
MNPEAPVVLCVNGGSSSLKLALVRVSPSGEDKLAVAVAERIGLPDHGLRIDRERVRARFEDHAGALHCALDELARRGFPEPDVVGHRLVHGGPHHHEPQLVDDTLLDALRAAIPFAPLHLPTGLRCIEAAKARFPAAPEVACFDTDFHWHLPEVARRLPLPAALYDEGVRRYGFHGLSYELVVAELGEQLGGRAVIAHLGNGASMVAVRDGKSIDTTMGLTPAGGLMMGTRSGDLDPGVIVHLLAHKGYDAGSLERMVDRESGLLAVSGSTPDMRALLAARDSDWRAALAVEMFCYQARKTVGAFAAALGGLDTLVFTGGIGEHAPQVRAEICRDLAHLGLRLDTAANEANTGVISAPGSTCIVRTFTADEERMIARHAARVWCAPPPQDARLRHVCSMRK